MNSAHAEYLGHIPNQPTHDPVLDSGGMQILIVIFIVGMIWFITRSMK